MEYYICNLVGNGGYVNALPNQTILCEPEIGILNIEKDMAFTKYLKLYGGSFSDEFAAFFPWEIKPIFKVINIRYKSC